MTCYELHWKGDRHAVVDIVHALCRSTHIKHSTFLLLTAVLLLLLLLLLQLRLAGNALAGSGDLPGALAKWGEALEMNPERGKHMLYSNMAVTHLQLGHKDASLDMARKAVAAAPPGFHVVGAAVFLGI